MNKIDVRMDPILLKKDGDFSDHSQQALMSWCEDAVEQFLETLFCKTWKRNKKEIAAFFIHGFVDYAYGYHLAKPFQYDAPLVENMCLDILPRKMSTYADLLVAFQAPPFREGWLTLPLDVCTEDLLRLANIFVLSIFIAS